MILTDSGFLVPGPIGARCGDCLMGPRPGHGVYLHLCLKTLSIVCAAKRACNDFESREVMETQPFLPHRVPV